jgi:hypothetical protein
MEIANVAGAHFLAKMRDLEQTPVAILITALVKTSAPEAGNFSWC